MLKERQPQMLFLGFGQGEDGRIFADCIKGIPHIILVGPDGKILEDFEQ